MLDPFADEFCNATLCGSDPHIVCRPSREEVVCFCDETGLIYDNQTQACKGENRKSSPDIIVPKKVLYKR